VKILVIDEVSYFSLKDLKNLLDRKLRRLKMQPSKPYGGVSIVFAGDLHQLEPVGGAEPFYYKYNMQWHGAINTAIILESNHRFRDDPQYGKLLGRIRSNTHTQADIELINTRLVDWLKTMMICPHQGKLEVCYMLALSTKREILSAKAFFNSLYSPIPLLRVMTCHLMK
jgi:hypothetical protein